MTIKLTLLRVLTPDENSSSNNIKYGIFIANSLLDLSSIIKKQIKGKILSNNVIFVCRALRWNLVLKVDNITINDI